MQLFCMLTLYPKTLLTLVISFNSFFCLFCFCFFVLVKSVGFSIYKPLSSANKDTFTSSFLTWMPFISFSCLTLARTSSTLLNRSDEGGYSCLVPDLRGKDFNLSPLSMILSVGLSYMAFIMLRYVPSVPSLLRVIFF